MVLIIKSRHSETRRIATKLIEKKLNEFPLKKIYPEISDSKLRGGLDFSETLSLGRPVYTKSIFDNKPKIFKLMMGERFDTKCCYYFCTNGYKAKFLLLVLMKV